MEALKPKSIAAMPMFNAASRCRGGIRAAEKAEKLLQELQTRYDETGDPEYHPLEAMYTTLLSAYSKVEPKSAYRGAKRVDELLEAMKRNNMKPSARAITAGKRYCNTTSWTSPASDNSRLLTLNLQQSTPKLITKARRPCKKQKH
jgi:hypothetical protein